MPFPDAGHRPSKDKLISIKGHSRLLIGATVVADLVPTILVSFRNFAVPCLETPSDSPCDPRESGNGEGVWRSMKVPWNCSVQEGKLHSGR